MHVFRLVYKKQKMYFRIYFKPEDDLPQTLTLTQHKDRQVVVLKTTSIYNTHKYVGGGIQVITK